MHYLRQRAGVSECRALGLCSGAYHAFKAAVGGAPLQTVVMINPLTFFLEGRHVARCAADRSASDLRSAPVIGRRPFRLHSWRKLMRGEVDVGRSRADHDPNARAAWLSRHWREPGARSGCPSEG